MFDANICPTLDMLTQCIRSLTVGPRQLKVVRFKPMYGYGWHQGKNALTVPATLEVEVDSETDREIRGLVRAPEGMKDMVVTLTLRTQSADETHWNVVLEPSNGDLITGFVASQ
ncbi:MAG: hypothetical protein R3F24_06710 [Gammaproteobacteria bacterium]